ncbi:MAG: hypothetical protein AAF649_08225 [Verrucomicrobiota bacterium]
MSEVTEPGLPQTDRSTRLLVCGILIVMAGVGLLALVPLMWLALQLAPEQVHGNSIWMAVVFYSLLGMICIALGVGSIRCRRWARDLILAGASFWLALGIPGCVFSSVVITQTLPGSMGATGAEVSSVFVTTTILFTMAFYVVLFIAVPLGLVLLYRGEPVLHTCHRNSGNSGWTTHLSIPQLVCVLICSLIFVYALFLPLFMPVVMVWNQVITGMPAILTLIVLAGLFGYATWGLYHQQTAGWWVGLVGVLLLSLNYGLAFYVGDMREFYQALEFPEEQIGMIEQSGTLGMMRHLWVSMVCYLAVVLAFFWKARPAHPAAG